MPASVEDLRPAILAPDKPTRKRRTKERKVTATAHASIERPATDYAAVVEELLRLYTQIDKAASSLSVASAMPLVRLFWSLIKFEFAVIGDFFLIVPINFAVFIRNLFPGHWTYKSFSWRYLKAAWSWFWMGEFMMPFIFFRPFTISLLHWHFRGRLAQVRRQILLETSFSEDAAKPALAKIDRALDVWQQRTTFKSILFTWVLPLIGPVTAAWNWFFPNSFLIFPSWTRFAVLTSMSYALGILATAFLLKRGLMLGGTGSAACYPGFLPGQGAYKNERDILRPLGLTVSEFPLDVVIFLGSLALVPFTSAAQLEMYPVLQSTDYMSSSLTIALWSAVPWLFIAGFALFRRKKLGRA